VCVDGLKEGNTATRIVKEQVDYTLGSPEMKANSFFENSFRKWILAEINSNQAIVKKDAINAGAELVGCSTMTIGRYLDKLLSIVGPLQEINDLMGSKILVLKDKIQKAKDTYQVASELRKKTVAAEKKKKAADRQKKKAAGTKNVANKLQPRAKEK
jgi:hypothetical protein